MQVLKLKIAVWLFLLLCFIALPEVSKGHVFPDHSDPKAGETVHNPVSVVCIWFDGDLEPVFSTISVQDSGGRRVDKADGKVDPANAKLLEVSVPLLPPGTYRVIWSVVARDGHRTKGDYTFVIK
jgi:methionine-rich copper-binding protein CopC